MWHQQIHDKLCDLLRQMDLKIIEACLSHLADILVQQQ